VPQRKGDGVADSWVACQWMVMVSLQDGSSAFHIFWEADVTWLSIHEGKAGRGEHHDILVVLFSFVSSQAREEVCWDVFLARDVL
jgi:hypothetical protein